MIAVTVVTNATRKQILAAPTETVKAVVDRSGASLSGATLMVQGGVVSASDINKTLADFGIADESTVVFNVTTKTSAAIGEYNELEIFTKIA